MLKTIIIGIYVTLLLCGIIQIYQTIRFIKKNEKKKWKTVLHLTPISIIILLIVTLGYTKKKSFHQERNLSIIGLFIVNIFESVILSFLLLGDETRIQYSCFCLMISKLFLIGSCLLGLWLVHKGTIY